MEKTDSADFNEGKKICEDYSEERERKKGKKICEDCSEERERKKGKKICEDCSEERERKKEKKIWDDFNEELERKNNSWKTLEKERWISQPIFKVPECIREYRNKKAFTPQVVSFGPYHHGEKQLEEMEYQKSRVLFHFLARSQTTIINYVEALKGVVGILKSYYRCLDQKWQDDESKFLQLMILDGCFMLEFLRWRSEGHTYPIFCYEEMLALGPLITADMLIIENQLPMLLLKELLAVEHGQRKEDEENKLLDLICRCYEKYDFNNPVKAMNTCLHVLDVYRNFVLSNWVYIEQSHNLKIDKTDEPSHDIKIDEIFRSAAKLHQDGVRIQKSDTRNLNDISFEDKILKLPFISFDDQTELAFLNVIAFELLHIKNVAKVTSYFWFMRRIVNSVRDVSLLHSKGIIFSCDIGSDMIVNLIKQLSTNVQIDTRSEAFDTFMRVQKYYKKSCKFRLNKWCSNFSNTYFKSPWTVSSLMAAILLMALTITQTVYTILSYYKRDRSHFSTPFPN